MHANESRLGNALVATGALIAVAPLLSYLAFYARTGSLFTSVPTSQNLEFQLYMIIVPNFAIALGGLGIVIGGWAVHALIASLASMEAVADMMTVATPPPEDEAEVARLRTEVARLQRELDAHLQKRQGSGAGATP